MSLSQPQLDQLRNAINADANLTAFVAAKDAQSIAAYLRGASTFSVYRTTTDVDSIFDAIQWVNLTPADNPDGTAAFTNIALACQGRQFNVQTMLVGRTFINSSKNTVRKGLQDALTNVPSGAGGALVNAGWSAVKQAMTRLANRYEAIFATGNGTSGSPGDLGVEGDPSIGEIGAAMWLPDGTPR